MLLNEAASWAALMREPRNTYVRDKRTGCEDTNWNHPAKIGQWSPYVNFRIS